MSVPVSSDSTSVADATLQTQPTACSTSTIHPTITMTTKAKGGIHYAGKCLEGDGLVLVREHNIEQDANAISLQRDHAIVAYVSKQRPPHSAPLAALMDCPTLNNPPAYRIFARSTEQKTRIYPQSIVGFEVRLRIVFLRALTEHERPLAQALLDFASDYH